MIVVSNTTPLIGLASIERFDLLQVFVGLNASLPIVSSLRTARTPDLGGFFFGTRLWYPYAAKIIAQTLTPIWG